MAPSVVAYWPAEGNANDIVGHHNGSLVGGTYGSGYQGSDQAFLLDGSDDYVRVPDSAVWNFKSKDFTINLWANFNALRPDDLAHPQAVFVGHDEGGGNLDKWFFAYGGGYLNWHINSPQTGPIFLALAPFTPNIGQWYNLQVTRSTGTYTIFVDGSQVSSQYNALAVPNAKAPLTMGEAEGLGFMNGRIDDVEISDNATSPAGIAALAQGTAATRLNLSTAASTVAILDALTGTAAACQAASAADLAPLAFSLLGPAPQAVAAAPAPGSAAPSAPPARSGNVLRILDRPAAVLAGAADVVFAASAALANDDNSELFAPFVFRAGEPL